MKREITHLVQFFSDINPLHIYVIVRLSFIIGTRVDDQVWKSFEPLLRRILHCTKKIKKIEVHMESLKNKFSNENLSILAWKLSIGSTISWELAKLLGSNHPYLAPLSVILTIQSTVDKTVSLSIKRMIGTIIGILVTVLITRHITINGWSLGILILLGCYISIWLKLDKKVLHQVALTILFVFVFEHQTKNYALDRLRDTLIGILIAGILQIVWSRLILRKNNRMKITSNS